MNGALLLARADELAAITAGPGLTRLYLTDEHRRANALVGDWMRQAGMAVRTDAAGNIIGRYEGKIPGAPALLLGSHLDTVRNAGRYDGMLGVLSAIACVEHLHRQGRRLAHAVEVIGFADEEGTRFQATLIGSQAVAGRLPADILGVRDSDGICLADALTAWGLDPAQLGDAARRPEDIRAYLELHIEQGPVLEALGQPVGVVTAIAGAVRLAVTVTGMAGHAGTVPMDMRCDALAAAAEMILAIEAECCNRPGVVGTVGRIQAGPGAVNVIPGRADFTIDLRSGQDGLRDAAWEALESRLAAIADQRGVALGLQRLHAAPAVACHPALMDLFSRAAASEGLTAPLLPSGAGHDAMALADLCPVAMLFIRCRGGISHNPAEAITAADAEAGTRVLLRALEMFEALEP